MATSRILICVFYSVQVMSASLELGAETFWVDNRLNSHTSANTQSADKDWGAWYWRPPFGDDPKDQYWIMQGIEYAKSKGY
jgi:hypothetical protein